MTRPGSSRLLLIAITTVALAFLTSAAVAACGGDDGTSGGVTPQATVTVTASPSGSASPSASAKPTATPKQLAIAVASSSRANGISVVGSAGQVKQLIAPSGGANRELAWSPDAQWLAFIKAKNSSSWDGTLWVYDLAGKKTTQVKISGAAPYAVAGFTWAGPWQLIAAVYTKKGPTSLANATLYLCDVQAGTAQVLKDDGGNALKGVWPSSSADFGTVVFVRYGSTSGSEMAESLVALDADTMTTTTVAKGKAYTDFDSNAFSYPAVSPNGQLVYTTQTGSDVGFKTTVYKITGAKAYTSPELVFPSRGAWDANTGRLAYGGGSTSGSALNGALNVWKQGSGSSALLKVKNLGPAAPAWTPRGKQVVYALWNNATSATDIWIVGGDGSNPHLLMKNGAEPACAEAPIAF